MGNFLKNKKIVLLRKNILHFVKRNPKVTFFAVLIFMTALFFRTYDYLNRIYVYADNSLFVQAAFFSWKNMRIPLVGPFAQAPFFTGPWWLWILSLLYIFPFGVLTPWYAMTIASFFFIVLMYFVGKEIGGKPLAILASLFATISTAQIDNSFMTWNASFDPYAGLIGIYLLLLYRKSRNPLHIFLLGFIVSLGTAIHFQSMYLFPLIVLSFFVTRPNFKRIGGLILGFIIPMAPFIYFDIHNYWFETRRIIDYVLIAQYRIYVPNRWLTYLRDFWPDIWGWIIGGSAWMGMGLILLVTIFTLLKLKDIKNHQNYFICAMAFILSVIALRYFRGERQFYYANYAHAYVLLITAWTVNQVFIMHKKIGLVLVVLIFAFTLQRSSRNLEKRVITYPQVQKLKYEIYDTYKGSTFGIYECPFISSLVSTPLSYIMYYEGRNSTSGVKIGVCNEDLKTSWKELSEDEVNREYGYKNKSTEDTYVSMTEWWIKNPPTEELY